MSLRVRFQYATGATLGYSIERLSDGLLWDFTASGGTGQTFTASPAIPVITLPEGSGNFLGRYKVTLASTPGGQFTDGDFCVTVHDMANSNMVVGEFVDTFKGGDDAPYFPAGGTDPWATTLPGAYTAGQAGYFLGHNLDAQVSSRLATSGYTAPDASAMATTISTNLNATVSSRSTYAGGPVASVTAPVTVGTNNDKVGYKLASDGVDAITIEAGVNLRQAVAIEFAICGGLISGAGTGTVIVKGGNVATTRLTVVGDGAGNRTTVTMVLP